MINTAAAKESESSQKSTTPTISNIKSKSIDDCGPCHDLIDEKPSIPYRTEKRNPLGSNTRLSCYKPQKNKLRDKSNNLLYNSVDDFLLLNDTNNNNDDDIDESAALIKSYYTSTPKQQRQPSPSLSTSSNSIQTPKYQRRKSEHFCNLVIKFVEDNKMSKSKHEINEDENVYGFTESPSIYQKKIFDDIEKNPPSSPSSTTITTTTAPTPTPTTQTKKDSSCFSNKIKAMSDRTQKLLSKLYRPNGVTGTDNFKRPPPTNNFEKNLTNTQRSFSYGSLIGIDDLSQNKTNKIICPTIKIDDDIDADVMNGSTRTTMTSIKTVSDNSEDGDSGILVNESGASSMMETEECSGHEPPLLPIKNCDEHLKDFKLVRLKVMDDDATNSDGDVGLGLILVPGSGFNCRYKVERVVAGGLTER